MTSVVKIQPEDTPSVDGKSDDSSSSVPCKQVSQTPQVRLLPAMPPWDASNWLTYYSQCCGFLLGLGQKFISLLTQASIYTTAVCAALIAIRKDMPPNFIFLIVGLIACAPLLVYWHFLVRYRKQILETGSLIFNIEENFPNIPDELKLLVRLRGNAPVYGLDRTKWLAFIYPVVLMLILLSLGGVLSTKVLDPVPSLPSERSQPMPHLPAIVPEESQPAAQ